MRFEENLNVCAVMLWRIILYEVGKEVSSLGV